MSRKETKSSMLVRRQKGFRPLVSLGDEVVGKTFDGRVRVAGNGVLWVMGDNDGLLRLGNSNALLAL